MGKQQQETDRARVKNASSTPSLILADVSMNLIPSSLASSRPCSSVTARFSDQSDLLPMRILFTPSDACCSMFACHVRMSVPKREEGTKERGEWRATVRTVVGRNTEDDTYC